MRITQALPDLIAPTSLEAQHRTHLIWAWSWFSFGLLGLADYLWGTEYVANSIPVLFFISVYANFTGHLSTAQAAKAAIEARNDGGR